MHLPPDRVGTVASFEMLPQTSDPVEEPRNRLWLIDPGSTSRELDEERPFWRADMSVERNAALLNDQLHGFPCIDVLHSLSLFLPLFVFVCWSGLSYIMTIKGNPSLHIRAVIEKSPELLTTIIRKYKHKSKVEKVPYWMYCVYGLIDRRCRAKRTKWPPATNPKPSATTLRAHTKEVGCGRVERTGRVGIRFFGGEWFVGDCSPNRTSAVCVSLVNSLERSASSATLLPHQKAPCLRRGFCIFQHHFYLNPAFGPRRSKCGVVRDSEK